MTSSSPPEVVRVLFVCLGNVCRSPSAAGVFERLIRQAGLQRRFEVDSAGTGGHFAGRPPDPRAQQVARRRGIDLSGMRARALAERDFERFDYILAMDEANLGDVRARATRGARLARGGQGAEGEGPRIGLLMEGSALDSIPDPYEGGLEEFERMMDRLEIGAAQLLERLRRGHRL